MELYLKDEMSPITKVKINIRSDAYLDGIPTFIKLNPTNSISQLSTIHTIILKSNPIITTKNVTYSKIPDTYLIELVKLHKEWFPINYDIKYFQKFIDKKNFITIGAFINLFGEDYLIGCALGEICNESKFKKNIKNVFKDKKWYNFFEHSKKCGYLNTIGVIDECRQMGIGSKLLEHFIIEMKRRECIALYLHVIEYNKTAINFYERNKWNKGGVIKKLYCINEKYYDAIAFYYIIRDKDEFKEVKIDGYSKSKDESLIKGMGCFKSLIWKIRKLCKCKKKKEKYEIL